MKGFYELFPKVCQLFGFGGQERSKQTRARMHRTVYHSVIIIKKKNSHGFLKLDLRGCMFHVKSPSLVLGEWSGDAMFDSGVQSASGLPSTGELRLAVIAMQD